MSALVINQRATTLVRLVPVSEVVVIVLALDPAGREAESAAIMGRDMSAWGHSEKSALKSERSAVRLGADI
jgi:hypothetical protein